MGIVKIYSSNLYWGHFFEFFLNCPKIFHIHLSNFHELDITWVKIKTKQLKIMYKISKNIHGLAKQTFQDMKKRKNESMNEIVTKILS